MSSVSRKDFDQYMVPVFSPAEFIPVRGRGSRLWDQQGKDYIDFTAGIAVNGLGHCHPAVVEALKQQADKVWHTSNLFTSEPTLELAKKLVSQTFADKVFFCNSGAEANEAALKLARKVGKVSSVDGKNEIIAFTQSFHGRTLFTVSTAGQEKYSQPFAPLPQGLHHVAFNDLSAVKAVMSEKTCAIIVEPIQGEGGVIPADVEFLRGLRQLCDEYQAVLIFDEVQTGMGRTGDLFAYMHSGVVPDILTSAKALGNGFPIGAMLTTDKYAKQFAVGDHGTTYGGNPLATAVASTVFDIIQSKEVLDGVKARFDYFKQGLEKINQKHHVFSEIRGRGLLIGAVVASQYKAKDIISLAMAEGVLALMAGIEVIRFVPSLIIPYDDIDEGLQRLERAIAKIIQ